MKHETSPNPSISPLVMPITESAEWTEHEHVSEQVQLEAQKLVDLVGSSELARNAIDVAGQRQAVMPVDLPLSVTPVASIQTDAFKTDPFKKALEDYETSLASPVIPGKLMHWLITAERAHQHLGVQLREDLQHTHAELYATILREDADLSSLVEELQMTDEQLLDVEYGKITVRLSQLRDRAQSSSEDEQKIESLRAKTVRQALEFVIRTRTQEITIATWLDDASNRNRGSGDKELDGTLPKK